MGATSKRPAAAGRAFGSAVAGLASLMATLCVLIFVILLVDPAALSGSSDHPLFSPLAVAGTLLFWCAIAGWGLRLAGFGAGLEKPAIPISPALYVLSGVAMVGLVASVIVWAAGLPGPGGSAAGPVEAAAVPGAPSGSTAALLAAIGFGALGFVATLVRLWLRRRST